MRCVGARSSSSASTPSSADVRHAPSRRGHARASDGIIANVSSLLFARAARLARGALPLTLVAVAVALAVDALLVEVALAQSTGGSFGGGSFGGGGGGSSGGSYSGGGDDGGDSVVTFIIYILLSRLPWPAKIALIGLIGGGWVGYKLFKKHRASKDDEDPPA